MNKRQQIKRISSVAKAIGSSLLILFTTANAFALDVAMPVHVRVGKAIRTCVETLKDLVSDSSFDGQWIKVVKAEGDDAISFNDPDEDVRLRASTVYFHMTMAREYYKKLDIPRSHVNEKVVVRIDQERPFSNVIHFKTNGDELHNGSWTVPASDPSDVPAEGFDVPSGVAGVPAKKIMPWGNEIWFMKPKKVWRKTGFELAAEQLSSANFKGLLMGQLLYSDMVSFTQGALYGQIYPLDTLMSMAFSVGLSEVIPDTIGLLGKVLKTRYELDSAMIPEIAVHEYAHFALSSVFHLKYSTMLNEGYPNYFAYKVMGLKKLGARALRFNHGDAPKSALNRAMYSFDLSMVKEAAWGSFTFSLLAELDEALGEKGETILVRALRYADTDEDLKSFEKKIQRAITEIGAEDPKADADALWTAALGVFVSRGL